MVPGAEGHRVHRWMLRVTGGAGAARDRICRGVLDPRSQMGQRASHGDIPVAYGVSYGWSSVCLGVGDSMELSLASGSLLDSPAGSAPGVSLSASAGLRMASSGPMATR